jgi:hypothetical protein
MKDVGTILLGPYSVGVETSETFSDDYQTSIEEYKISEEVNCFFELQHFHQIWSCALSERYTW